MSEALQGWWKMSAGVREVWAKVRPPHRVYGHAVLYWGTWQEEIDHQQIFELPDSQGCLASVCCGGGLWRF